LGQRDRLREAGHKTMQRYVDEQVFRFNNRATKDNPLDDGDRFMLVLSQIVGKRLTYAELTGFRLASSCFLI